MLYQFCVLLKLFTFESIRESQNTQKWYTANLNRLRTDFICSNQIQEFRRSPLCFYDQKDPSDVMLVLLHVQKHLRTPLVPAVNAMQLGLNSCFTVIIRLKYHLLCTYPAMYSVWSTKYVLSPLPAQQSHLEMRKLRLKELDDLLEVTQQVRRRGLDRNPGLSNSKLSTTILGHVLDKVATPIGNKTLTTTGAKLWVFLLTSFPVRRQ